MKIPFFRPHSSTELIKLLEKVVSGGQWTGGVEVDNIEKLFVERFYFPNFSCTSSATSAFELLLDIYFANKEATIVVPTNTFVATAEVPRRLGHNVVFCDVDPNSGMIDPISLENLLTIQEVDCVVPVSIGGHLYNRTAIKRLKDKYRFKVIEDLAQLIFPGCYDLDIDASFFSFYPNKILSSPDGGGIVVTDVTLIDQIKKRRLHGINRDVDFDYDIEYLGRKANMTNVDAVFLKDQLSMFDDKARKRLTLYKLYEDFLRDISQVTLLRLDKNHIASLFIIHAENRDELRVYLKNNGVETSIHFKPLHMHSYWRNNEESFKGAEQYFSTALSLPFYESLSVEEISYISSLVKKFYLT